MRKVSRLFVLLIALGAALISFAYVKISAVPGVLQYSVAAPEARAAQGSAEEEQGAQMTASALKGEMERADEAMVEMRESIEAYALCGYAPNVAIYAEGEENRASDLFAVSEKYFRMFPMPLFEGRSLQEEELKYGDRVALISSQLAVDLFRVSNPTGRTITVGGAEYLVTGVLRHDRDISDASRYRVYLPLAAIAKDEKLQLQTLTLSVLPTPGSGADVSFERAARAWRENGSYYKVEREKVRATLLFRLLLSVALLYGIVRLFKALFRRVLNEAAAFSERLRMHYLIRLLPGLVLRVLLGLIALAALSALCMAWANYLIYPVLLFPEWVPEIPVEWSYIEKTFWALRAAANARAVYWTDEVLTLRFYATVADAGCIAAMIGVCAQLLARRVLRK